jgi:hypothetical protein
MAHPFFNATKYPLHRPEAVFLLETLSEAISNQGVINTTYEKCGPGLPALFLGQAAPLVWTEALQNLTAFGFLRKLLDLVQAQFRHSDTVLKAVRDVVNAQTAEEIKIISDDVLVLDRAVLRNRLKELVSDANPIKVLLVRGAPQTGKSHGRYIFERFANDQGAPSVYLYPEIIVTVQDVIEQLFSALQASDEIPDAFTTDDAWYQKVCVKLMEVASKKKQKLWIAVDDLGPGTDGAPLMDKEVRKFCERFAANMLNPIFRNSFRLMLIHYPEGSTPTKWRRDFWTEDRTSEADVQKKDVVELLKTWSLNMDRKIVDDELISLAEDVITKAEVPPPQGEEVKPRLQRIHEELKKALSDLARKTE